MYGIFRQKLQIKSLKTVKICVDIHVGFVLYFIKNSGLLQERTGKDQFLVGKFPLVKNSKQQCLIKLDKNLHCIDLSMLYIKPHTDRKNRGILQGLYVCLCSSDNKKKIATHHKVSCLNYFKQMDKKIPTCKLVENQNT